MITKESKFICPNITITEATVIVEKFWNKRGVLTALESYLDQNFLVTTTDEKKYVLKIANTNTTKQDIEFQTNVLIFLSSEHVPKVIQTIDGNNQLLIQTNWVRLFEFIDGKTLSQFPYHSNELLDNIAIFSANLSIKLSSFQPQDYSNLSFNQWDLKHSAKLIKEWIHYIDDANIQNSLLNCVQLLEHQNNTIKKLRTSVIHNDITRFNLLFNDEGTNINGIIDFGDVCNSWTIAELTNLLLETIITNSPTPFLDVYKVVKKYNEIFPITEDEISVLYYFIRLRSALIVCASARQLYYDPTNDYIKNQYITDLQVFQNLPPEFDSFFTALCMDACGFHKAELDFNPKYSPIIPLPNHIPFIDISPISDLFDDGACANELLFHQKLSNQLKNGYGYTQYLSPTITSIETNGIEKETIALGVYLFLPENSEIYSPFDLTFVSQTNGKSIFKHNDFYLYITGIKHSLIENQSIVSNSVLGFVQKENNNNKPTHITLQIDHSGTAPFFCKPSEEIGWRLLCEDPTFLIGITSQNTRIENLSDQLYKNRETYIQQAQEYYYKKPMNLVRGWMQYLFDENGQIYLDAINNVTHIGHSHPKITEAAAQQFKKLNTNARFLYKENIEYSEKILALFPPSLNVIFFTCTGSEANDLALRLARCYTEQQDVIVIDGEYHGNTTAVDEISTCLLDNPTTSKSNRSYTHPLIQPNTYRGKYKENIDNVADLYALDVEDKINYIQSQGRGVAAFISECLLGSGGGVEMPKYYLQKVYKKVKEAGGVCIADEVQIGFGRMGTHFWGFQKEEVLPDIVTIGKPMGNGYPIAAVVTTQEIATAYKRKYTYFNTYSGNAVACKIASTTLDVMKDEKLQENALLVGGFLKNELQKLVETHKNVGAVYGHSMYLGVDIITNKQTKEPNSNLALQICEKIKQKGIIIYPTGDYYNILKIKPPMCFTKENAEFLVKSLQEILNEIEK